ncbi:MAG: hypothetical protein PHI52_04795 [Bacteroidales bacterium]|nr:hypothetical protein [Bacteroidales bacterium]
MIKKFLFIAAIGIIAFSSCKKKDFSLNSNYEDFTIVYALLNPDDSVHYMKIYKNFLTDGNAYDAAKDIRNYSYIDSIEVTLEEYNGTNLVQTYYFDTTTFIPKDSGIFAFPLQILYTSKIKLNRNYSYKVVVRNLYTQKITTATTRLVGDLSVKYPIYYPNKINNITFLPRQQQLEFTKGENITLCQASFYYYYTEVFKNGNRRQAAPVVFQAGESTTEIISYFGENLLRKIKENVKVNDEVDYRYTDSVVLKIYTASNDLYLYLLAISASTGLNQERMEYTNVKSYSKEDDKFEEDGNALGIVASRGVYSLMFDELSKTTNDSLLYGRFTGDLKFIKYDY